MISMLFVAELALVYQFCCSMTLSKSERQIAAAVPAASICRSFSAEASKRTFPEAGNSSSGSHKLNFIGMRGRKENKKDTPKWVLLAST